MSQNNGQPSSSAMAGSAAYVQDEVLELNRKFHMWISSSWEMCPHFCWNGAAQEYINQMNRILDGASRPGSTSHSREPSNWGSRSPSTHQATQPVTLPPPKSMPLQQAPEATTQPLALSPTLAAPSPIPSASPTIPDSSGRSRKRAAQGDHPDDPNAQAGSKPGISFGTAPPESKSAPKPKPAAPFQLSKRSTADEPSAPGPAPPLFSTFASSNSKPASASAPPARAFSTFSTTPSFGTSSSPPPRTTPAFGAPVSASAAASQPNTGPSFSFKPAAATTTASNGAADPKPPSFPLFSGIPSTTASSSAAAGGFSTGFSFGKPAAAPSGGASSASATAAGSPAPLFNFGKPADGAAAPVSASFSFAALPAGTGGSDGGGGTPTFNFGGAAAAAAPAAGAAAAAAPAVGAAAAGDGDEEAQEKPTKVEIKGDDKTDITFAGKTAFRTKGSSGWGDPVSGLLTLRRDKASGRCWMQVNSESKGSIFVYASVAPEAKFRVTAGKPMVNLVVNVFRYPPGQEPHKMGDDGSGGKKQLPEKEDNPASAKSVMIRVKKEDLPSFVASLKDIGCQKVE